MTSSPYRRRTPAVAVVSLLAVLVTAVTGSAATGGADKPSSTAPPSEVFTTIVASPVSAPHPVRGADGRRHLAYELQVVNPTELAVTIDRVEIVDPATDDVVGVLEGEAVGAHLLVVPEGGASSGATLGPGGVAFLVMDAALAPGGRVPRRLVHVFSLSLDPDIPELAHIVRIGATDVVGDTRLSSGRRCGAAGGSTSMDAVPS